MSPLSTGTGWVTTGCVTCGAVRASGSAGLEDRLLLMAGPLAEHAVEAEPDEQGDQNENDDDGQCAILCV